MERANGDLQRRLGKWLEENKDCGWALGLQHVMYSMNTSMIATKGKTPYEVVYLVKLPNQLIVVYQQRIRNGTSGSSNWNYTGGH